jgi:hypothetical protein
MKLVQEDKKVENTEEIQASLKESEAESMGKALEEFRQAPYYRYVCKFFDEYEAQLTNEIYGMQTEEMRKVFMLPLKEQRAKIAQMSKRDSIITGVLSIIKQVRRKL